MIKLLDTIGLCFEHPAFAMCVRSFIAFSVYVGTCELVKMRSNDDTFIISWFNVFLIVLGGLSQVAVVINANMSGSWARYFDDKRNNKNEEPPKQ